MASLVFYDGVGCIGGNKILLTSGGSKVFLDFGLNFGVQKRFYEEFLKPKSVAGLYEPIEMGLLPPFRGLYREDLVSRLADPYRDERDWEDMGDVSAILLSHAHADHLGLLHYVRGDLPVFCSPMTLAIARASQDTAGSGMPSDYCYYVPRAESENGGGLSTPHFRNQPSLSRQFCLTGTPGADLTAFWGDRPGERGHIPRELLTVQDAAGLRVMSWPVDHSLYGATAWAVETDAGWVVYTGDLRTHGRAGELTRRFAREAAGLRPVALIIEGTRVNSTNARTEEDILHAALEKVRRCSGLVIADFGPRNVERLLSFLEVARATGRRLAILPKDAYLLRAMSHAEDGTQEVPSLEDPAIVVYLEYSSASERNSWSAPLLEGLGDRVIRPDDVRRAPGEYIVCLSYFDLNELPYLRPPAGSLWMYSACEAVDEEMEIDAARLRAWLEHFGLALAGNLSRENGGEDPLHVSGHASQQDLREIIETIRPDKLIPVHTLHPEMFRELAPDGTEVVLPAKGEPVRL